MFKKKLNLFLITKKNNNYKNIYIVESSINLIKYLNFLKPSELVAYTALFKSVSLLKKLNKTIFIFQNNYIIIIYKNDYIKKTISYKFKNLQVDYFFKIYIFMKVSILINTASNYLKFKSEHERYLDIFFDCYHNKFSRDKISTISHKMFLLVMYFVL